MLWLALTLLAYIVGVYAQQRSRHALVNPTLIATGLVALALLLGHTSYAAYKAQVQPISLLLSPAVVALAVPMYKQRRLLRHQWPALVVGGAAGTLVGTTFDTLAPRALHLDLAAGHALSTATVTSPVALALAQHTGAPPALAAILAVLSGLMGAVVLPPFLSLLGIQAPLARGIGMGSVSHGVGTARAREEGEYQGVASSIGMGLAVLVVSAVVALLG